MFVLGQFLERPSLLDRLAGMREHGLPRRGELAVVNVRGLPSDAPVSRNATAVT